MSKEENFQAQDDHKPPRDGPIAWMVKNPVAANLLMIILLGGGIFTAFMMQKEVYPDFELDIVQVEVEYPGASPEEIEQSILQSIEEAVRGVEGIREMTSRAREGSGYVSLELVAGIDRMKAFQDIDQAVNRIRTFPIDAEKPEVTLEDRQRSVIDVTLFGDVDVWKLRKLAERLRDRLLLNASITQVAIQGLPGFITHVDIPQHIMRQYNLTHAEVASKIRASAQDVPAGTIESSNGEILLRLKERKQAAATLAAIVIVKNNDGSVIRLGDIAQIEDGFERVGFFPQFDRTPSLDVDVYRVGDQSPLEISEAVLSTMEEFESELPEGVSYRIGSNAAEDFKDRLILLAENGVLATVIVFLILSAFLAFRLAFWIMMGMVISFVGGILFMPMVDVSINMISMFAFLVVLGIVVDDAIVVGENVYRYRQQGLKPQDAAIKGCQDIATPVTFTILTTIVAFLPVIFIPGTTGKFWYPLPVVVIVVLLVSLIEALFILPAHLARSKVATPSHSTFKGLQNGQALLAKKFEDFTDKVYAPLLSRCLQYRYITLSAGVSLLLIVAAYGVSDHMGLIVMPRAAADEIEAGVRLPVGTTRSQAAKVANDITEATMQMYAEHNLERQAEGVKSNVRRQTFIDVEIVLRSPDQRSMSAAEIIQLWRDEIGDIDGVEQISFEAERGPGGWVDDISVDLSHDNTEALVDASRELLEIAKSYSNTRDVSDSYRKGKIQFNFTLLPVGEFLGLTPQSVGRQLREAFYGAVALRQLRGTNEFEIRVKLPERESEQLYTLEDFALKLPNGNSVPLSSVVALNEGAAFSNLDRRDGRRIINVSMDVEPQSATSQVIAAFNKEVLPQLRKKYPGLTWDFRGSEAEMRESTAVLWSGFAMALFVIYALLAVAFKNYSQPLIVMLAIPFGVVGAVIGHLILGFDLSLVSLMGLVALSGVVVNGALIMVAFANTLSKSHSPTEAILQSASRRFRPVILTTLTTFGGLTPIILESSRQAYQLIPMAISLGFGIIFATTIMLIIVPCLYLVLEDIQTASRTRRSQKRGYT